MNMTNESDNISQSNHREILIQVDIKTVINYFGVTELLDNIGISVIEDYLKAHHNDWLHEENDGIQLLRKPEPDPNNPSGVSI